MEHMDAQCWNNLVEPRPLPPLPALHPLLVTNGLPTESESPTIQDFIATAKQLLASLDTKIAAVACTMDTLVNERAAVAEDIRSHMAVVSPFVVRRIPTEILCRILSMALRPLAHTQCPEVPWHLGHICKRWREIAVDLRCLWSSFGIHTSQYRDQKNRVRKADPELGSSGAFQEQLRRTGNAPLQVTILGKGDATRTPESLLFLVSACERWEMLAVAEAKEFYYQLHWDDLYTPLLQRLHLGDWRSFGDVDAQSVHEFDVPWPSLSTRDFKDSVPGKTLRVMMERSSGRVSCSSSVAPAGSSSAACSSRGYRTIYNNIDAPELEELAVDHYRDEDGPKQVLAFLVRVSCTILRLSVLECKDPSLFLPILRATPSIREFTIACHLRQNSGMVSLLETMATVELASGEEPLLPNLTAVSFGNIPRLPTALAVKVASARFQSQTPYKQLRFFGMIPAPFKREVPDLNRAAEVWTTLGRLQSAGLHLGLVSGEKQYESMLATDPYSMHRCTEYTQITSDRLWD
ncbi:hypothetical protein B0H17DRAFT_1282971 [Mycena rosella]|uniref:F-box domain-containing protein n=1 Tax=Mycena rosella TaxID=1033263 RepID=A0AAD7BVJ1_MYCRO|nr:hypothetical protein B0H17DRAFT_1282971 [Mycena rosella]